MRNSEIDISQFKTHSTISADLSKVGIFLYFTMYFAFQQIYIRKLKNLKLQEARKQVSYITRQLGYLHFKYFQLDSRNLVLVKTIILIVCT